MMDALHNVSRNPSGPAASEDPGGLRGLLRRNGAASRGPAWTAYPDAGGRLHGYVKHPHHVDDNHSGSNLTNFFARLFEFFPFYVVHDSVQFCDVVST